MERPRWSIQPGPIGSDVLFGVSCASSWCLHGGWGPQIYTWNGHDWSSQPIPSPADATATTLNGVSCMSPDSCVAVGTYDRQPLRAGTSL